MNLSGKLKTLKSKYKAVYDFTLSHEWALAILLGLSLIVIGSFLGIKNNQVIASNPQKNLLYLLEPTNRLSFLANWDGVNYISIALHGYKTAFLTGWFPVYPILIMVLHRIISSALLSALTVSWLCLIGAIYYYMKIIKLYYKISDNTEAIKATLLFVLFPSGMYLLAAYTESLFALLSLAAIYYVLKRRYVWAALLGMLATATRINGWFIVVLVLLIMMEQKEKIRYLLMTLIVGGLGLFGFMIYLSVRYHDALEFLVAQRSHHWLQYSIISRLAVINKANYLLVFIVLWTAVYWWSRRKSFAIYSALYLLIPLFGGQFGGYPRYILMLFPLQFMLYEYSRSKKLAYTVILILFSIGWTYVLLQFATGYVV